MKTLLIAILLMTTTISVSAKTTNLYKHARDVRISSQRQQNVKNSYKRFFFATKAAKAGNPKAQFDLAIMYATGRGVQKNEREAFYWFHKSARVGNIEAKYYMGISFEQGRGVKANLHLARYWFKLSAEAGYSKAIYHLAKIEKSLNHRGVIGLQYEII